MGAAPQTVNYKGEVLTEEMQNYLFGEEDFVPGSRKGSKLSPDRAQEILQNWLYGLRPKPIDPSEAIGRASALRGGSERVAAGSGMGGLFGFGKYIGEIPKMQPLGTGPLAPGVPYAVPPLPRLQPGGRV